jgi:hypothetical protein
LPIAAGFKNIALLVSSYIMVSDFMSNIYASGGLAYPMSVPLLYAILSVVCLKEST